MNEDKDFSDSGQEVVYLTEYGAAVPAWVTFDAARWWRVHPVFPSVLVVLTGVFEVDPEIRARCEVMCVW